MSQSRTEVTRDRLLHPRLSTTLGWASIVVVLGGLIHSRGGSAGADGYLYGVSFIDAAPESQKLLQQLLRDGD